MNLYEFSTIVFEKKTDYSTISDSNKEKFFFKFNQCIAKFFPDQADFLNKKRYNSIDTMDIWFSFLTATKKTPKDFINKKNVRSTKDNKK